METKKTGFAPSVKVMFGSIALVLLLIIGSLFLPNEPKPAPAPPTKAEQLVTAAKGKYSVVKNAVATKVSNPNTLDMHLTDMSYQVSDESQGLVVCKGSADAQNDFGVEKEFIYEVLLRVEGETVTADLVNVMQ